jgi:putative transcriptional regulator
MAIHQEESLAESEVLPNLYFTAEKEKLEHLVVKPTELARFYAGYAGWSAGQLEAEVNEGAWFSTPAKSEQAFWNHDDLWDLVCHELSATTRLSGIKLKHEPPDPSMN